MLDPEAEQLHRERAEMLYDTLVSINDPVEQLLDASKEFFAAQPPLAAADCQWTVYERQQCVMLIYKPTGKPLFCMTRGLGNLWHVVGFPAGLTREKNEKVTPRKLQ
jgi:hypothetical protein